MSRIIGVLQTVLPVLIALGIGMLCRSRNILSREGVNALKRVAVDIALPAVLLSAFATTEYSLQSLIIPLLMFAVCVAGWLLGILAGRFLKMPSRYVPFLTTGFEAGMLGYTLYAMLYGAENTAHFAIVDLGQVLFVFTMYKILLSVQSRGGAAPRELVREMLASPIIIAIIAGILLGATGLYQAMGPSGLSGVFDACTDFISAPTSLLILLSIGYDLVWKDIRWKDTARLVVVRLVIMLLLMLLTLAVVGGLFGANRGLTGAILVMFILPPPFVLPVFADDADERVYISSSLSVSTLVAVAGFAVLAALGL